MTVFKTSVRKLALVAGLMAIPFILSGCVGSSTYGTGKTSGEHLVDGLGGLLGSPEKKAPIDYKTRPDLVKPPEVASLPEPIEGGASTSGSDLPQDPEIRRALLRRNAPKAQERSGELPIEFMKRRRGPNSKTQRVAPQTYTRDDTLETNYDPLQHRSEFLKRKAELAGAKGAAPRKYLTEPPRNYRTPVDTAPIGDVGEDEEIKARRRKGKKSWSWRDLNPFS